MFVNIERFKRIDHIQMQFKYTKLKVSNDLIMVYITILISVVLIIIIFILIIFILVVCFNYFYYFKFNDCKFNYFNFIGHKQYCVLYIISRDVYSTPCF